MPGWYDAVKEAIREVLPDISDETLSQIMQGLLKLDEAGTLTVDAIAQMLVDMGFADAVATELAEAIVAAIIFGNKQKEE